MVLTHSLLSSLTFRTKSQVRRAWLGLEDRGTLKTPLCPTGQAHNKSSLEPALKALLAEDYSIGGHRTIYTYAFQISL